MIELCKKSAWSEEDEKHHQGCLNLMRLSLNTKPYPYYNDYLWLKSLKERVQPQPKQEWSEEDENMLKSIIATCELAEQDRDSSPARHLFEMQTNWLKSLKERMKGE